MVRALAGNPKLIIVHEPTAGLDPEERLRVYRLFGELAEDRTVMLSNHIVEDVAVRCPPVAVTCTRRVIAESTRTEEKTALTGSMFEGAVESTALADFEQRWGVT